MNTICNNQRIIIIQTVVKNPLTLLTLTPNMDGKNSSRKDYISLITITIIYLFVLLATIIYTGQKEHGKEEKKKHLLPSVEKLLTPVMKTQSKYGEMACKPDHSSTLTNVSKPPEDSWNRTAPNPSISDRKRWLQ